MTDGGLIAIAAVGLGALIRALKRRAERRAAHRVIVAHPELSADLPESTVVRITGIIRPLGATLDGTLTSPMASKTCVAYRARASGRLPDAIGLVRRERAELVPFVIERADGLRVHIESTHAQLDLPEVKYGERPREAERQFILSLGFPWTNGGRFEEVVAEVGVRVSVVGLLMFDLESPREDETDAERGFRDAAPAKLRVVGNAEHPIAIGVPVV